MSHSVQGKWCVHTLLSVITVHSLAEIHRRIESSDQDDTNQTN